LSCVSGLGRASGASAAQGWNLSATPGPGRHPWLHPVRLWCHHNGPIAATGRGWAGRQRMRSSKSGLASLEVITAYLEPVGEAEPPPAARHDSGRLGYPRAPAAGKNVDKRIKGTDPTAIAVARSGETVAWRSKRDGPRLCVDPGPRWPTTSAAINRTQRRRIGATGGGGGAGGGGVGGGGGGGTPASKRRASSLVGHGADIFSLRGQIHPQLEPPWNRPPELTKSPAAYRYE